ncbi:lipid A deacylase LpxR family protein [Mucilaginibacter myungsuensis]|uniref:Lipid A deacylase LpxR family protein n=1 Tax=Mucilaginibacter myungsuensis TaxID=649104 RepID=A0A929L393_9SPHI|nr:lipid A deacylase LpxR family protein [Mucilaginibacter myungsuensis]MBE9663255.1 lipid A deacylase LpxR family protein [Mucilaginibacter myungsuensis]MDN3598888.1 lipid A deacylase LpxR family protein [Mucilaginibacter myungsuensis]
MKLKFLCLMLGILSGWGASAQTYQSEIGLQADNDSFLGKGFDRYYTNGIFLNYRTALTSKDTSKIKNKILGFDIGQKIYNPQTGRIGSPAFVDRPFAGYLYGAVNLNLLYANESNLKLTAQVGVIGPGALGEEIQTSIHDWFGFYELKGWEYQVHDGAQLNLWAEYNKLLIRKSFVDLTLATHAALGNGFTGANAGLMLRAGRLNPLYNSVSTQSTVSRSAYSTSNPYELFAYYKPMANYIAYDATIQGSLFNKKTYPDQVLLTRMPWVFNSQIGGALAMGHWVVDLSVIVRTKDVKEMRRSEQWGSVAVNYRF